MDNKVAIELHVVQFRSEIILVHAISILKSRVCSDFRPSCTPLSLIAISITQLVD